MRRAGILILACAACSASPVRSDPIRAAADTPCAGLAEPEVDRPLAEPVAPPGESSSRSEATRRLELEARSEIVRIVEAMALRHAVERIPSSPEPTDAEIAAAEAQLPWLDGYLSSCLRFQRLFAADGGDDAIDALVAEGRRRAEGRELDRVRARIELDPSFPSGPELSVQLGRRTLAAYSRYHLPPLPDPTVVASLAAHRDGDCVLVTGRVSGMVAEGHPEMWLTNAACGFEFETQIDRIDDCEAPADHGSGGPP